MVASLSFRRKAHNKLALAHWRMMGGRGGGGSHLVSQRALTNLSNPTTWRHAAALQCRNALWIRKQCPNCWQRQRQGPLCFSSSSTSNNGNNTKDLVTSMQETVSWIWQSFSTKSLSNNKLSKGVGSDNNNTGTSGDASKQHMHWRMFQTLLHHVWPSPPDQTQLKNCSTQEEQHALIQSVQERKQRVVFSLGLLLAGKAVTLQVPYLFKHLVDTLPAAQQTATDVATLAAVEPSHLGMLPLSLLLGYGVARAASTGFHEWRNAVFLHVAQDAIRGTGRTVFDHTLNLDLQFHLSKNTGQVARVLDRGQRSIQFILNAMVFHIAPTLLEVSLVTGLLAYQFGWAHANVALSTVGVYVLFTVAITQWRTQFRRDMNRLENQASSRVVDSLLNYETVQYFNNAKHEGERYEESLRGYQTAALDAQKSLSLLNFGQAAIFSVGLTTLMGLTASQVVQGTASVGDLVLVNGLLFQLSVPLFFIGSVYREVRQCLVDMEHMFDLMDRPSSLQEPEGEPVMYDAETMGTDLELDHVYFSYPTRFDAKTTSTDGSTTQQEGRQDDTESSDSTEESDENDVSAGRSILQGTTLSIPQGSTVAVVGTSGCGKSTLLRLWYRFYDASAGRVLVGGRDVREYDIDSLRRAMAVIPQDVVLFHESVLYNLQYGNLKATQEEVLEAARKAQLHDTIMSFPQGYETVVGERGLKLSGGEKQRMAIARALLKRDAQIWLADEPTSALDSTTEAQIMRNIKSLGGNNNDNNVGTKKKTLVLIAHRLSTVQDADLIIVMDQGRVAEQGTHTQLLSIPGGKYAELWKRQEALKESL